MESAEFKTYRETLGIDRLWLSEELGVSRRTVQRWENPAAGPVPEFAAEWMRAAWETAISQIADVLNSAEDTAEELGSPQYFTLARYIDDVSATAGLGEGMTARMHAARVGLIAAALQVEGFETRINWILPND